MIYDKTYFIDVHLFIKLCKYTLMHGYGAYIGFNVTQSRRKGLVGHLLFMGGFKSYMFGSSEKLNGRGNSTQTLVHSSMEDICWDACILSKV